MTRPILVTCLCVAALAGCTRTVVREVAVDRPVVHETVVERPVVRETVIDRQAMSTPLACSYAGVGYTAGSLSCQSGYQYQCSPSGVWDRVPGRSC
jgi:hypothetical protein